MSRCDMQGHATQGELESLYMDLISMSEKERAAKKFALFVKSKGMLDGNEALAYLKAKWGLA